MADFNPQDNFQELLAGYVLGNLSSEEAEEFQQRLADHPELEEEVYQLQEILATLPYGLPEAHLRAELRASVLDCAQADKVVPLAKPSPSSTPKRLSNVWQWVSVGAAAAAIAIGVSNYQLQQQLSSAQTTIAQQQSDLSQQKDLIAMLQDNQTHVMPLKGVAQLASASGSAVVTSGHKEAILIIKDLPNLPEGQTYLLWEIANGKKIACGAFRPNASGNVFVKMPVSFNSESTLAITVETSANAKQPKGPMVMSSGI